MGPDFEVFGVGQCALDRLLLVPALGPPDAKVEGRGLTVACGGPVATALVALARWGRRCAFAGVVGDDEAGARILADLEAAGVDASRVLVRPRSRSQQAFVAVEEGTGRRTIYWERPTGAAPRPGEVEAPSVPLLLTDGLFAEASLEAAARAERVLVDAGTLREGTRRLLEVAHAFVASQAFARSLLGRDDPEAACRRIREHGPEVAGVTLGAEGYVAHFEDRLLRAPAHVVPVLDTTGCGDVFHAGLAEGLLSGWPLPRCFDFAAWAAAQCATRLGGRAGIPDRASYPGGPA